MRSLDMYLGSRNTGRVVLNANQTVTAYDDEDSDSDDDVIDVLSAGHCTGEHSYTMQMPSSMVLQARKAAQRKAAEEVPDLIPELQSGYRLVQYLTSPACQKYSSPFMKPFDTEQKEYKGYNKVITNPMWFNKVKECLDSKSYTTITEVVRDVRLVLENCYRFFGPSHSFSKRAVKLETVLEQKLALLPRELREKTSIEATTLNGLDHTTLRGRRARLSLLSSEMSPLMSYVKSQSTARAREERLKQREERRFEKEVAQQVACDWDQETFKEELSKIATMWEVPQVCQFLALAQPVLNLPEVAACEVERMFLMPQQSTLLATVMTCLLVSPHHRSRVLQKGPMPYRIWQDRLNTRLALWYKTYHASQRNLDKVFEVHGVERQFFEVLGDTSPLESKSFHELEIAQRVWLVKSLCDYKLQHHKMVQEHFAEQDADGMRERVLGEDASGRSYLYFPFPSVLDLRVYRRGKLAPIAYRFVPPTKPTRKSSRRPLPSRKSKRKGFQEPAAAETDPSKRSARLRQVTRPVLRRSYRREATAPRPAAESASENEEAEEEETNREEDAEEEMPNTDPSPEEPSKEPSFETVATSVAELRSLVASLERKAEEDETVATRSRTKQEEGPSPGERTQAKLAAGLRALLSELESCESRFQQTEATVRLKLYKEWHAFANKTDDQEESNRHEEAWNAWTVRYRDEDSTIYDESEEDEEESAADEEYKEETAAGAEACPAGPSDADDGSTVRVLRKRKIVVRNGDLDWSSWGDQESPGTTDGQVRPPTVPEESSKPWADCNGTAETQLSEPEGSDPKLRPGCNDVAGIPGSQPGRSDSTLWPGCNDVAGIPGSQPGRSNSTLWPGCNDVAGIPASQPGRSDSTLWPGCNDVAGIPGSQPERSNPTLWQGCNDVASIPCSEPQESNSKPAPVRRECREPQVEAKDEEETKAEAEGAERQSAADASEEPGTAPAETCGVEVDALGAVSGTARREVLADNLTRMFANTVPRALFPKRTYSRPVKINALLEARLKVVPSTAKQTEKRDGMPASTREIPTSCSEKPKEANVVGRGEGRKAIRVPKLEQREAPLKKAGNAAPQRREKQTIRKMTLVPAVDEKGENVFLRVEYTKIPDGAPPTAAKPTETAPPKRTTIQTPKFYTGSPLKYGISSQALAPTAREIPIEKQKQENRRPTILKVRPDAQDVPRTFNLPWWKKKNGIAVSTHMREVPAQNAPGQKKFFRSKNAIGAIYAANCSAEGAKPAVQQSPTTQKGHQCSSGVQRAATERDTTTARDVGDLGTAARRGDAEEKVSPRRSAAADATARHGVVRRNATVRPTVAECNAIPRRDVGETKNTAAERRAIAPGCTVARQAVTNIIPEGGQNVVAQCPTMEQSVMLQHVAAEQGMMAQGVIADRSTAVQQGVEDRNVVAQQSMIAQQNMIAQQQCIQEQNVAVAQQVDSVQHRAMCDRPDAFPNQNAVMPLQNFGTSGLQDVILSQSNGTHVVFVLPELVNNVAAVQQQTMLLQQTKMVDPSTYLSSPPRPDPGLMAQPAPMAQPNQIPQLSDMNAYAMQPVPAAPKEQILQSAMESCLLPTDMGQDAMVNVVRQLPEEPTVQQQPVFFLTADGHLIQIVPGS